MQVICRKPDFWLEQTSTWDAIGLRGTCSNGFRLLANVDPSMINPVPFAVVASSGGIQAATILLSAAWVGLAEAAAAKAHAYVRAAARRSIGTVPPAAGRLAEVAVELQEARSMLTAAATRFTLLEDSDEMESPGMIASVRNVKVATSELAVRIATASLEICGIAGFKRDTPFALDRQIRDAHGGCRDGQQRALPARERRDAARAQAPVADREMSASGSSAERALPRRLAFAYHPRSFGTMAIAEAAQGICELVWIVDTSDARDRLDGAAAAPGRRHRRRRRYVARAGRRPRSPRRSPMASWRWPTACCCGRRRSPRCWICDS